MPKQIKPLATPDLMQSVSPELLGQAIKARRTQSQLRLDDAAALCGVAKQTLMNIEHGQATAQLSSVLKICSALGIKLAIVPWQEVSEDNDDWQ